MVVNKVKIRAKTGSVKTLKADMLIVGAFEDGLTPDANSLDKIMKGDITNMIKNKEFKPEFKETKLFRTGGNIKNVLLVGLGKKKELDIDKLRKASASIAKDIRDDRVRNFVTTLHNADLKATSQEKTRAVVEGILLGLYKFEKYKKPDKDDTNIDSVELLCNNVNDVKRGIEVGTIISNAVNYSRDITNEPGSIMTPTKLAEEAKKMGKANKLKVKVFGKNEIKKMGMGGLLGVSRGSREEPRFIVLEYKTKSKKRVAIVGKGVTFDSGGLDIKSSESMLDMKGDKAGACTVLGVMQAVAKLKAPINVVAFIPATENMPGSSALKPGDIIRSYDKKTIEITHTDAEGRLILADALSYAERNYKLDAIIDLATLTGSSISALGYDVAPLIGTDEKLIKRIYDVGQKTSEKVWQLPLWEEYKDVTKSDVADVKNLSMSGDYKPGAIYAAAFLEKFIEKIPWAHIDLGGAGLPNEERDYIPKGISGFGVRLITQLLLEWK